MDQKEYCDRTFSLSNEIHFGNNALFWIELANQRLANFSNQLFGIAFIILPFSASLLVIERDIREFEKTLLILSWIFLGLSLIAGLIQIIRDGQFFAVLSNDSSNREKEWSDWNKSSEVKKKIVSKMKNTNPSSTSHFLYCQILLLFIGVIMLMVIAGSLLLRR